MSAQANQLHEGMNLDPLVGIKAFKDWTLDKIQLVAAVICTAMLYGGVLYYTWNPLATSVKTAHIHGFWTCTLVVLGAYGVVLLVRDVLVDRLYNPFRVFKDKVDGERKVSKRAELFATVVRPGAVLLTAWLVATYFS